MMKKIEFTKKAEQQILKIIKNDNKKKYFRITVKGGGCSGFKYQFSFDDKVNSNDFLLNNAIIIICTDTTHSRLLHFNYCYIRCCFISIY